MKTDIQIAQEANMLPIVEVAKKYGINPENLDLYGKYKAKINDEAIAELGDKKGKLVLVTAINPTPAGEGKTTTTIGLSQALNILGKKSVVALREPSLGPCMGMKGGAAGGGYAQVVPMEDINLHFTGDLHAITAANNLLASMIDNHIHYGNKLNIDVRQIAWKRALDINDRALRSIIVSLGGKANGYPREDGFVITVASEIMAIMCLAENLEDLRDRLGKIVVAYNYNNEPVTCADIEANGAMTVLLKEALKPNLVQTVENTAAIIHGGPFANIAHGCNSIRATKIAMAVSDIAITEAGFGADLGAEKFFDIKCRKANLSPDAVVLVATIRALKYNGGVDAAELSNENVDAVEKGFVNLEKHIENLKKFGVPVVVTLNHFYTDSDKEVEVVKSKCENMGARFALSKVWGEGGKGGIELANSVIEALNTKSEFKLLYEDGLSIKEKIKKVCTEIYGASSVAFSGEVNKTIRRIEKMGFGNLPVCMAKTQYSLSDNPKLLGRPRDFEVTVREVKLSAGAGFVVCITGEIMTMPGLPRVPAANKIDIDEKGDIQGLF